MKRSIVLLLLCALFLSGCSTKEAQSPTNQAIASQESIRPAYIMAGKVEAVEKVDISTKISGRITELKVDVGSIVNKGDILLILDAKDKDALVNQAVANLSSAEANINSTSTVYENAKLNHERTSRLFKAGAVSKQALEMAEAQKQTAEAQKQTAENQVVAAQSQLDLANANLADATIVAPVSGVVSAKNINAGELAVTGMTLLSLVNSDSLYINAYLPARLSGEVRPGQKVTINLSEIPGKLFDGEITEVGTVVDAKSKSILVKVGLSETDPALKVGMLAEVAVKK